MHYDDMSKYPYYLPASNASTDVLATVTYLSSYEDRFLFCSYAQKLNGVKIVVRGNTFDVTGPKTQVKSLLQFALALTRYA